MQNLKVFNRDVQTAVNFDNRSNLNRIKKKIAKFSLKQLNYKITIAIVIVAMMAAWHRTAGFPIMPFTDAICFLPQAVKYAQGDGLRNVYCFSYFKDGAFIWHGFLYPMTLGGIFHADSYLKASRAQAVLNSTNILLISLIIIRITPSLSRLLRNCFLTLALTAQMGYLDGLVGRPESLSSLLFGAGVLLFFLKPRTIGHLFMGMILGFLFVTSPLTGASGLFCLILSSITTQPCVKDICRQMMGTLFGAVLSITFGFFVYPYSFKMWLHGVHVQSGQVMHPWNPGLRWFVREGFSQKGHFMIMPMLGLALASALIIIWESNSAKTDRVKWILVLLFGFGVFATCYWIRSGYYIITDLFPVAIALFAYAINSSRKRPLEIGWWIQPAILTLTFCASIDPILSEVGRLSGHAGLPFETARQNFSEDTQRMDGQISISWDLAALSDRTERFTPMFRYSPSDPEPATPWLIVQQHCFHYTTPPKYKTYELVCNRFAAGNWWPGHLAEWFGVDGYGYAIYKRIDKA